MMHKSKEYKLIRNYLVNETKVKKKKSLVVKQHSSQPC